MTAAITPVRPWGTRRSQDWVLWAVVDGDVHLSDTWRYEAWCATIHLDVDDMIYHLVDVGLARLRPDGRVEPTAAGQAAHRAYLDALANPARRANHTATRPPTTPPGAHRRVAGRRVG